MYKYGFIFLLNIFYFSFSQIIYEFNKDLDLKDNMTKDEIFTQLAYNDLYTYIKIGTPEKELKVSLSFQEKSLVLLGSQIKRDNIFNESDSRTYKSLSEVNIIKSQIYNGYISEDVIKLNNFEKSLKIQFILGEELYDNSFSFNNEYEPVNFAGYIGLSINSMFRVELPDSLPIYLYNNYKDDYNFKPPFSIIFDKSKDKNSYKGKLILNGYPHEYNNSYKDYKYCPIQLQKNSDNYLDWCIAFDNIYYDDNIIEGVVKILFRPEIGVVIVNGNLFNHLTENYFKEYNEKKICILKSIILIGNEYKYYSCSKEINITKFKNINYELKEVSLNFTLNYEDLFYEYNNVYYFLMLSSLYRTQENVFGSVLMKKYDFVFDRYNSKIGLYKKTNITNNNDEDGNKKNDEKNEEKNDEKNDEKNEEKNEEKKEENKSNLVLIISIVILCVLIILVLIYIIWSYLNKPRIQRKNEINDDYNYVADSQKIN